MAWWSWGKRKNAEKNTGKSKAWSGNKSVAEHVQARNEVATEYSRAMDALKSKVLTPEDRYRNLVKTYRSGKDLMVVPTSWMGRDLIVNCPCKKIYVETPTPSIVRTR